MSIISSIEKFRVLTFWLGVEKFRVCIIASYLFAHYPPHLHLLLQHVFYNLTATAPPPSIYRLLIAARLGHPTVATRQPQPSHFVCSRRPTIISHSSLPLSPMLSTTVATCQKHATHGLIQSFAAPIKIHHSPHHSACSCCFFVRCSFPLLFVQVIAHAT